MVLSLIVGGCLGPNIYHFLTRPLLHSPLHRSEWKAASRRSARIADKTDERQTDGTISDHPAARGSLRGRVWVLPRRLLPSRRARRDRRHTRIGPGRPRDRMAGARAYRGPLSLSYERPSLVMCNRAGADRASATRAVVAEPAPPQSAWPGGFARPPSLCLSAGAHVREVFSSVHPL